MNECVLAYTWTTSSISILLSAPHTVPRVQLFTIADDSSSVANCNSIAQEVRNAYETAPEERDVTLHVAGQNAAQELFTLILPAKFWGVVKSADRLVISPDGPLHSISFESLVPPEGGYVVDFVPEILYTPPGIIQYLHKEKPEVKSSSHEEVIKWVILGDPDFGISPTGTPLPSLPGTRLEATRIADLLSQSSNKVTLLLGKYANLNQLEFEVHKARYIHLGTHGLVGSPNNPFNASVVLSKSKGASKSDLLNLSTVINDWPKRLANCELVVLAACNTLLGNKWGDSVMSLPWGFLYAGVQSVVASLWKVADLQTAALMMQFYIEVLKGSSHMEGLCFAKRWLRQATAKDVGELLSRHESNRSVQSLTHRNVDTPFADPYYWSPFVMFGWPS